MKTTRIIACAALALTFAGVGATPALATSPTTLTINGGGHHLVYGTSFKLTGLLTGRPHAPTAPRLDNEPIGVASSVDTTVTVRTHKGVWTMTIKTPTSGAHYQALFPGDSDWAPSISGTASTYVRPSVTALQPPASAVKVGSRVIFSSTVAPDPFRSTTHSTYFRVQYDGKDGWRTITTATIYLTSLSHGARTFYAKTYPGSKGQYRVKMLDDQTGLEHAETTYIYFKAVR